MRNETLHEVRRQAEVCNACRYCEGYCSVFPALQLNREFTDSTLIQLANLCHNCRGCYYACQYTSPHEFNLNVPKALAELRQESWEDFAYPAFFAKAFHRKPWATMLVSILSFSLFFVVARLLGKQTGDGFYSILSHGLMVAIFMPAFVLPLLSIAISMRRYWKTTDGGSVTIGAIFSSFQAAGKLDNLRGGHGDGCNFEDTDRFTHIRRYAHMAVMYGFLLCFAATSVGTVMHYLFDMVAPYSLFSLPKILGISGGLLLGFGVVWMAWLKTRADKSLSDHRVWDSEMAFMLLLGVVSWSGIALYAFGTTVLMPLLLTLHLGSVLSFFVLMPYSKMVHGFYRIAALIRNRC